MPVRLILQLGNQRESSFLFLFIFIIFFFLFTYNSQWELIVNILSNKKIFFYLIRILQFVQLDIWQKRESYHSFSDWFSELRILNFQDSWMTCLRFLEFRSCFQYCVVLCFDIS